MIEHLQSAPLPEIDAEPAQRIWEERIGDLLREVRHEGFILRGGTAARLGHGLTRPSQDIDADLTQPRAVWSMLENGASRAGMIAVGQPEGKSALKGRLMLTDKRIGMSTTIGVDIRIIREREILDSVDSLTEHRNGILMYSAGELARQKVEMAIEPGRRRRAKDRYDITWWLHNHIEHVRPGLRAELDEALREDRSLRSRWEADHARNATMRRVNAASVRDALVTALDRDPAALERRWPLGGMEIHTHARTGATIGWRTQPQDGALRPIATCDSDAEVAQFMRQMQLLDPREIPELLKQLTQERARVPRRQGSGRSGPEREPGTRAVPDRPAHGAGAGRGGQ